MRKDPMKTPATIVIVIIIGSLIFTFFKTHQRIRDYDELGKTFESQLTQPIETVEEEPLNEELI